MKTIIVGSTSVIAKRVRSPMADLGPVLMAGRSAGADVRFDLTEEYRPNPHVGTADVLIHCAAAFEGNDPAMAVRNELANSVGALRVAQLARDARCGHVVYLSTVSTYDHPANGYFGSYGLSKRHGQENLEWACREMGVVFTALVATQVYDDRGEARKHQPLFYRIMDAARAGRDVTFHGKENPERNFLFVADLAEIVRRVVVHRVFGIHPVLHPQSDRLSEIAQTAFEVFGNGGKVVFQHDKPNIPGVFVPAPSDLFARIEYTPATALRAGVELIKKHSGELTK